MSLVDLGRRLWVRLSNLCVRRVTTSTSQGGRCALAAALGGTGVELRGPGESVLSPPTRASADGRAALSPGDLRLPGGRAPHDFLRGDATGGQVEVERFETVRPDAIIELATSAHTQPGCDVIVELDDRLPSGARRASFERYDHFVAGWSLHTDRYGRRAQATPVVVFVCRDRSRARECARRADSVPVPAVPMRVSIRPIGNTRAGSRLCSPPSATLTRAFCTPTASPACRRMCV